MKNNSYKPNILFLECGSSGQGGSFKSLKEHIEIMQESIGAILVVLVNDSVYVNAYEALGCIVIQLWHPIYSNESAWKSMYNKLFSLSHIISSKLSLNVQALFEKSFSKKISGLCARYDIDLLYLNNQPMRNFSGFMVARKKNIPIFSFIRTLHTYGLNGSIIKYIERCNLRYIAISETVRHVWTSFGLDDRCFSVIYNPVPVNFMPERSLREYDLVYVGRLVEGKGIEYLLKSFSTLKFKSEIKLVIVGDGYLRNELENMTAELKISKNVIFLGYRSEALNIISKSKILTLPTEGEGFGRVIIEAMKLKTLVISTGKGATSELIKDNHTGLLYESDSENDLSSKIETVLSDDKLYNRIVNAAYQYATDNFTNIKYKSAINKVMKMQGVES